MKRASLVLALLWAIIGLPGIVLGYLWSGDIPVWPPVVSGATRDFLDWIALFILAYGLPLFALALFVGARFTGKKR